MDNIQGALKDIELIKNTISKTKIMFNNIKNFYLVLALFFILNLIVYITDITLILQKNTYNSRMYLEVFELILFVVVVAAYLYYRKIIALYQNQLSLFLIDIWGYTVIITKLFSILANYATINDTTTSVNNIFVLTGVGICFLSTGLLMDSN